MIVMLNTLGLCGVVGLLAIPIGTFLGWLITRTDVPGRRLFFALMLAMAFMPLYLQAAAWEAGFGQQGWFQLKVGGAGSEPILSGFHGAAWVHAVAILPWVTLIAGAHFLVRSPAAETSALVETSVLGVFRHISLAEAAPAMGAAALWTVTTVMSEISVTDLFQVRTLAEEVYLGFALDGGTLEHTDPLIILGGVAVMGAAAIWLIVFGARRVAVWEDRVDPAIPLNALRWVGCGFLLAVALALVSVPVGSLFYKAGVTVEATDEGLMRAWSAAKALKLAGRAPLEFSSEFGWTLLMAHCASATAVLCAVPAAWLSRRSWVVGVGVGAATALAIAVNGPILGVSVIHLFHIIDSDFIERLYSRTVLAPTLALLAKCFPLVMLVVWMGIRAISDESLLAAELQGATFWAQLRYVVLPWKWPLIVAAWLLGMAASMSELSGSILTVPPGVTTLSIRTFGLVHYGVEDRLAALCLATIGLVIVLLIAATGLFWCTGARVDPH